MNIKKFAPLAVASIALAATFSFAPAANADTPAESVYAPSFSVADDGSYNYVPGEWTGDVTTLTVAWYSCPVAQLGAIGDAAELAQQLADAGCTQVSTDKSVPAETFDNVNSFPVIVEIANETAAAFMGNSFIMYDKGVGPIAYNYRGQGANTRTLFFGGNSATLNAKSRSALYALLAKVGSTASAAVTIDAYAAKGGSAAKNASIARGRARQIMFFLKKYGVTGPFKIKLRTSTLTGAAGRKATVKLDIIEAIAPQ